MFWNKIGMPKRKRKIAKHDPKTQALIDACVKNSAARRRDPKEKQKWREQYSASLDVSKPLPPTSDMKVSYKGININEYEDPLMQEREEEARRKAQALKSRVGPAFNKGGLQLLGKNEIKDSGRKTRQME